MADQKDSWIEGGFEFTDSKTVAPYIFYNKDGKEIGRGGLPSDVVSQATEGDQSKKSFKVYYNRDKNEMTGKRPASVSLDKDTGKITVTAPKSLIDSEYYKSGLKESLKTLSSNYKLKPDYKYNTVDSAGNNVSKDIEGIIEDLNTPSVIKEDPTSWIDYSPAPNTSSLDYIASAAEQLDDIRYAHKRKNGVEMSDSDIMVMSTSAIGDEIKDNTLQAIPKKLKEANFLRRLGSYDESSGMVNYKDLMNNGWNRDKHSDDELLALENGLTEYFKAGDFSDPDEYARCVALYKFIKNTDPEVFWLRDIAEIVPAAVGGVLSFATDLGTTAVYAGGEFSDWLNDIINPNPLLNYAMNTKNQYKIFQNQLGFGDDFSIDVFNPKAVSDQTSEQLKSLVGEDLSGKLWVDNPSPMVQVDSMSERVNFTDDEYQIPFFEEYRIEGSTGSNDSIGALLRNMYVEGREASKDELAVLSDTQASADVIGYEVAKLAALISAGNVLSSLAVKGATSLAGWVATRGVAGATETIQTVVASNLASGSFDAMLTGEKMANGMGVLFDVANLAGNSAKLVNGVVTAMRAAKTSELIIGVVGESLAEAVVGDPDRLVSVISNKDIDEETKSYLLGTYVGNALGWGVGTVASKALINAGKSVKGRAISYNWSRRLFKVQNGVGDAFDRLVLTINGLGHKELTEQVEELLKKGTNSAIKRANSLTSTKLLRKAREIIANSDAIEWAGKNEEDIQEALAKAEGKVIELKSLEISLESMKRRGVDIASLWLKDSNGDLGEVTSDFYKRASSVADAEKVAGDAFKVVKGNVTNLDTGKIIKLFSQNTTNYIKATEKLEFINNFIRYYDKASEVSEEVVKSIEDAKAEIPELKAMIKKFTDAATPELKLAADEFIAADRKWWYSFNSLRKNEGLIDGVDLDSKRASGIWGEDGILYAKTTRKKDLTDYAVKHADGNSDAKTFSSLEHYEFGASGDFADPMGEMQIALYQAAEEKAYNSVVRTYGNMTGGLNIKVSGSETALVENIGDDLIKSYNKTVNAGFSGISEDIANKRGFDEVINNLQLKNTQMTELNATKKAMNTTARKMQKTLGEVNSSNANRYIHYLNAEDTNDLYNEFYAIPVDDLVRYSPDAVPDKTRKFIFSQAKEIGMNVTKETSVADAYDEVKRMLTGTADSPDFYFENQVKRSILANTKEVTDDATVQKYLTIQRQRRYELTLETMLKDRTKEYEQLEEELGVTKELLNASGRESVESYVDFVTEPGTKSRVAIDKLCAHYGLEGDESAIRYFALSGFMDNEKKCKKELFNEISRRIESKMPDITKRERDKIAGILTNGVASEIEVEFSDSYNIVKEMNPNAVRKDTEKIFDEVKDIQKKIEGVEQNRFTGENNIVALRNPSGQVEYIETDPLLARLVNFNPPARRSGGAARFLYNVNYLWAKMFRLGTTAINIKSMISQTFRDPVNMLIGAGAYRSSQKCLEDMTDVFGNDIVEYYRKFEPEALRKLQAQADETGETIESLAAKRELEIGKIVSPEATETNMYQSLKNARSARATGDISDVYITTKFEKVSDGINKVEDTLAKPNAAREVFLRNTTYANAFDEGLHKGYSVAQARIYARYAMNEATTNFGRAMNHLTSLQGTVPYLGAAVNGTKSFWRLLSMDPVGVAGRLVGGLIIPTTALAAYSLSSEENREVYKNIPEYQKENSLVFVINGQAFSIPIPEEMGAILNPFRQVVESMYGVSSNTFSELLWHDILAFSPIELTGFADLDYSKIEGSSPGFMDRIGTGITKMWSQLAPAPLKSAMTLVTGVDPYTGQKIDTSYTTLNSDGELVVVDYKSGKTATGISALLKSWGVNISAPVIQNTLSNIFGTATVDISDFLCSLTTSVASGKLDWSWDNDELEKNQGYNPFYTLTERMSSPVLVGAYDEAQSAWKKEVSRLYTMKAEILNSDAWKEYLKAKSNATSEEEIRNLNSTKINIVEQYYNEIKKSILNLQNNYGEQFTAAKYASVLSLMTMDEQTLDAGAYGEYLEKESYKTSRAQAIQTMMEYGFPSSSDTDILGKYRVSQDGNIYVEVYHPLAILQLDDRKGAALSSQSKKQHFATVKKMIDESDAYDWKTDFYNARSNAYAKKDYKEVERLTNEYNKKIIDIVFPYIKYYGAESVLSGDTMDYLKEYIAVPEEAMGKGKYWSSKTGVGANKQEAFRENYIKKIFNYGGDRIDE